MSPKTHYNEACWLSRSQRLTPSRCRSPRPQAPLGPLNDYHVRLLLFPQQLQQGRHWAPILKDTWIRCSVHRAEEALELKQKIQLRLESDIMISWNDWLKLPNQNYNISHFSALVTLHVSIRSWILPVHHSHGEVISLYGILICYSPIHHMTAPTRGTARLPWTY
jgi:hypothetical protein